MRLVHLMTAAGVTLAAACGSSTAPGGGTQNPNGISIQDFSFTPATLPVKVGTTVTWTNNGPSGHTTTTDAGDPQAWSSGTLTPPSGGGASPRPPPRRTHQSTFITA